MTDPEHPRGETTEGPDDRPVRLLVVDDQFLVRSGLAALLRAAPGMEVVGEAADDAQAVAPAAPERLLAAVATVHGGDSLFAPAVTRRLVEAFTRMSDPARTDPPDAAPPPGLAALTSREAEVLGLVGRGLSNAEAADRLFVSEATVKTHLNRTMSKLRLSSRAQAVVVAYETGLVTPGSAGDAG
ncbi:response regulator transcription factor [Streptomyces sp. NPDC096191]|uniref:response regulator transcription factor n=1 Tax=Streptomyces sp. NPDC096191 TaxID=3155426 RepID=UPI003321D398